MNTRIITPDLIEEYLKELKFEDRYITQLMSMFQRNE